MKFQHMTESQICDALQKGADLAPMSMSIQFDHETAISLAHRFIDKDCFCFLESAQAGPKHKARYSYIGFDPLWRFELNGENFKFSGPSSSGQTHLNGQDPLKVLWENFHSLQWGSEICSSEQMDPLADHTGMLGWINYDCARFIEPSIHACPKKELGLPDIFMFIPETLLILDHLTSELTLIVFASLQKDQSIDLCLNHTKAKLDHLNAEIIKTPSKLNAFKKSKPHPHQDRKESLTKEEFIDIARKCKDHILKGDIFQIQIGNRISQTINAKPFDIFRHLRMLNPSPYMFYCKYKEDVIAGASPEAMVLIEDRVITHRPIAGTRKRTWQESKDKARREELKTDEKERAEHIMLVDLSRNDIVRVSQIGAVQVEELMCVEEYSHVYHLVSQVCGKLKPEISPGEALSASFPNGTVSGAPKIKAMQLINQYEKVAREFYAGCLGFFTFSGNLKSTLLIRSFHARNQVATTQASAGIVYDSDPELEWNETQHKMAACLTAIEGTQSLDRLDLEG